MVKVTFFLQYYENNLNIDGFFWTNREAAENWKRWGKTGHSSFSIFISCWNRSSISYKVQPAERIAQMVFVPVEQVILKKVDDFTDTDGGSGGFGHSGKQ